MSLTIANVTPEIQEMCNAAMAGCAGVFSRGRQIRPIILFRKHGKKVAVEIPEMAGDEQKDHIAGMIRNLRQDCEGVCFATECWMRIAVGMDYYKSFRSMEEDPKRQEGIGIQLYLPQRNVTIWAEIHRKPDRLEPWKVLADSADKGSFTKSGGRFLE